MQIHAGVYWSVGMGHRKSQDSLSLQHIMMQRGECLLAVVCDGIGSLQAAEDAGGIVVSHLTDWFYHEGKELIYRNSSKEKILLALQKQILQIQEVLRQFQQNEHIKTGTTCSAILIIQRRYYLIHIGDSRIYQIKKKKIPFLKQKYHIECLTRDDCDERGYLYKALGLSGSDRAFFSTGKIRQQTFFLLCTDGFYQKNDMEAVKYTLGSLLNRNEKQLQNQIERRLEMLGRMAAERGSRDDRTGIGIIVKS